MIDENKTYPYSLVAETSMRVCRAFEGVGYAHMLRLIEVELKQVHVADGRCFFCSSSGFIDVDNVRLCSECHIRRQRMTQTFSRSKPDLNTPVKIRSYFRAGMSVEDIAQKLNVKRGYVVKATFKLRKEDKRYHVQSDKARLDNRNAKVRELSALGYSKAQISKILKVPEDQLKQILKVA